MFKDFFKKPAEKLPAIDLGKGAEIILPENSIAEKIALSVREKRPLIIKLGLDPTAPDLHLGHTVVLRKLREFQDAGHKVVLIIGDFTARIGDPTGKNKTRPPLSLDEIEKNSKTYIDQLSKILDIKKVSIRRNSEWLGKMDLADTIKLLASYNLGRMLARDDFKKRFESETPIAMHELMYPLLQGQDSIAIKADIEMGGTDQLFNLQVGRSLQETNGLPAQAIICMPLLRGTDGTDKMSKSLGNYIGITEEPRTMFGKVMSIPDDLLPEYIDLVSSFDTTAKNQLKKDLTSGENPMNVKKKVAENIVEQFHSRKAAEDASNFFYKQFQDKSDANREYKEVRLASLGLDKNNLDLTSLIFALGVKPSKTASRSLIEQGGVELNGEKITDPRHVVSSGQKPGQKEILLKCGKLGFYKVLID